MIYPNKINIETSTHPKLETAAAKVASYTTETLKAILNLAIQTHNKSATERASCLLWIGLPWTPSWDPRHRDA